jgi:D-psicose/D-tagatose/L-ribulose 3-epimerase
VRNPEVVAAGEALLHRCLEFLSDVGGTHLVGVVYSAMRKYMTQATHLNRQHSLAVIGRLSTRAAELGIQVGVEVVNRYESNVLNTSRQAVRYVEDAGVQDLLVHLDTYHMNIEEPDMFTPVLHAGSRLGYVHIGRATAATSARARSTSTCSSVPSRPSGTTARWSSSRSPRRSCIRT